MERPTIKSSGPDIFGRTQLMRDHVMRRAEFGPIRPMEQRSRVSQVIGRLIPLHH